ncbi:hypothetical protein PLESTB_000783500 [Pleodorina starrii]|uniref:Methyltransferase type 11 domain-containing protein n=1 Tax=Pleodorina starrii TaxID=330485 RepID=A0A9W6BKW5_9CHLO|nr:hypothetical protein PLESTM_000501400 [Pleodorina starrii]GLC53753.1 hypothetical protein PLESTB_000783500 [Pleodorina starrii]GLC72933.1 hypothetical protein PLESTF_001311100 [Pleodorina starrii]
MSALWLEQAQWRRFTVGHQQFNGKRRALQGGCTTHLNLTRSSANRASSTIGPLSKVAWESDSPVVCPQPIPNLSSDSDDVQNAATRRAACALAVAFLLAGDATVARADEAIATSSAALELQQAYDGYSSKYDDLDGGAAAEAFGFPQLRQKLLEQARGNVLEVAVGTGLNLPYYRWDAVGASQPPAQPTQLEAPDVAAPPLPSSSPSIGSGAVGGGGGVTSLSTVDLSPGMLQQAQRRVTETPALSERPISFREADVAALPFPDSSFDSVVDTFSLCVFPDPQAALNELARVVRPASSGGRVLLLEHCRSDNPLLAAYQDATASPVAALGKGCVWNQDVEGLAARAGLVVVGSERAAGGTVELLVAVKQRQ